MTIFKELPPCLLSHLLFLRTTPVLPRSLNASLIGLYLVASSSRQRSHETTSSLERSLEITRSRSTEQVDLDNVALECALERDDALNEQRVGVLEVKVHESHHSTSHQLLLVCLLDSGAVVCVDGGSDKLGLVLRSHLWWLDVFEGGHV